MEVALAELPRRQSCRSAQDLLEMDSLRGVGQHGLDEPDVLFHDSIADRLRGLGGRWSRKASRGR